MKCKQKLCQRIKNLQQSGNCNVCEEAIAATIKSGESSQKKVVATVQTDLKMMISTHEKLLNGETIDRDVVNTLLLGGVINILGQHDKIDEMEKRMKSIEVENETNKCRI